MVSNESLSAALKDVLAEKAQLQERLREIDRLVASLVTFLGVQVDACIISHPEIDHSSPQASGGSSEEQPPKEALEFVCRGRSISDAALAILMILNRPTDETTLLEYLVQGGMIFTSPERSRSIHNALRKKERETGAVREIASGIWGMAAWKETNNPNHMGFVAFRDKAAHMQATLEGLKAAREGGRRGGRSPKITEEHAPRIKRMILDGISNTAISEKMGVTPTGLYKAIQRLNAQGHDIPLVRRPPPINKRLP